MLDPYAAVATSIHLPAGVNVPPPKKGLPSEASNGAQPPAYLGCLAFLQDSFDWQGTKPPRTFLEDTFILEVDIPSFLSGLDPALPKEQRGKRLPSCDAVAKPSSPSTPFYSLA